MRHSQNVQFATSNLEMIQTLEHINPDSLGLAAKWVLEFYCRWVFPVLFAQSNLAKSEFLFLCDVFNGTLFIPDLSPSQILLGQVLFAVDAYPEYPQKWGFDPHSLLSKLRSLDDATAFTIVDAIRRFWNFQKKHQDAPYDQILDKIGIASLFSDCRY